MQLQQVAWTNCQHQAAAAATSLSAHSQRGLSLQRMLTRMLLLVMQQRQAAPQQLVQAVWVRHCRRMAIGEQRSSSSSSTCMRCHFWVMQLQL
jgi:hypothetical protein